MTLPALGEGSFPPEKPPSTWRRDEVPPGCPLTVGEFELLRRFAFGYVSGKATSGERNTANAMRRRLGVWSNMEAVRVAAENDWLRWTDFEVTPAMRDYLRAFDEHLMDRLPGSRDRMLTALARMRKSA